MTGLDDLRGNDCVISQPVSHVTDVCARGETRSISQRGKGGRAGLTWGLHTVTSLSYWLRNWKIRSNSRQRGRTKGKH